MFNRPDPVVSDPTFPAFEELYCIPSNFILKNKRMISLKAVQTYLGVKVLAGNKVVHQCVW